MEQIGFADIHVFPYSARKGTVASRWEDTPAEVKHLRAERLGEIKRKLKSDFLNSQIGKTEEVLAERSRNGMWEAIPAITQECTSRETPRKDRR